ARAADVSASLQLARVRPVAPSPSAPSAPTKPRRENRFVRSIMDTPSHSPLPGLPSRARWRVVRARLREGDRAAALPLSPWAALVAAALITVLDDCVDLGVVRAFALEDAGRALGQPAQAVIHQRVVARHLDLELHAGRTAGRHHRRLDV